MIKQGDKVTGTISGKYLGIVEIVSMDKQNIWIRAPDGSLISMSPLLVNKVPDQTETGVSRVWVGS